MAALAVGGHVLGTIAGITGARTQALAAEFQGQVEAANAHAEADAYRFNSKVAKQMARNTQAVARATAMDFRRRGSARLAQRRAAAAGSGVVATSGSPLIVDKAIMTEIGVGGARIINEGDIVSTRQLNEAALLKGQAENARRNARFALEGGRIASSAARLGIYTSIAQGAVGVGNTLMQAGTFG